MLRNPLLEGRDRSGQAIFPRKEDGTIDEQALEERAVAKVASLIVDWVMWDKDSGAQLPLPSSDPDVVNRCPVHVLRKLNEACQERLNPTRAEEARPLKNGSVVGKTPKNPSPIMS